MKNFITTLAFMLAILLTSTTAQAEAFYYCEDFDNPEMFPDGATTPQGWISEGSYFPFARYAATDFGMMANSGSYIMATLGSYESARDEVFYTHGFNLKGGAECSLSFYLFAPGGTPPSVRKNKMVITAGTAQNMESQTIAVGETESNVWTQWTQYSFKFTPETDGTYYFAFKVVAAMSSCGNVAIDDIEISGETPDTAKPSDGEDFYYCEDFDNPEMFPDGATTPQGWISEGSYFPFARYAATDFGMMANSGSYIMATLGSYESERDEVFYTHGFNLKGGAECSLSFYLFAPGGTPPSVRKNKMVITAGTAQNMESQTIAVGETESNIWTQWTQYSFKFTPETDGTYYFAFKVVAAMSSCGNVAIDDIEISGKTPGTSTPKATLTVNPTNIYENDAFTGETYEYAVNIKGENFTKGITVTGETSTEVTFFPETITAEQVNSEVGVMLSISLTPTTTEGSYNIQLQSEELAETVNIPVLWTATALVEIDAIADFKQKDPTAAETYIFKGEAIVTFIDSVNKKVYMQDGEAGIILDVTDIEDLSLTVGDKVTGIICTVADKDSQIVLVPANESLGMVLSSDNTVEPINATLTEIAAAPTTYINRIVKAANLVLQDVEMGDVFTLEGLVITDGTTSGKLEVLEASDVCDNAIPALKVDLTGIALSATDAVIAPRNIDDIEARQDPVIHETQALPYMQSFDDAEDYDGVSYMPVGWKSTGTVPVVTASDPTMEAVGGTYYLYLNESDSPRDERIYTPFFDMKAGTEYTVSYYICMPGQVAVENLRTNTFTFTVGTEQEAVAQTKVLTSMPDASIPEWTKHEFKFTPETDDQYCFAFNFESPLNYTGIAAIDEVLITAPGLVLRPTVDIAIDAWFDIMDSGLTVIENEAVQMVNLSKNATSYEWTVKGAEPETSTEKNPEFKFPQDGRYTIKLTASNVTGQKTTYKEIDVKILPAEYINDAGLTTWNPAEDAVHYSSPLAPVFDTDPTYDFVCGINHYYHRFAQRYELPGEREMTLKNISIWLTAYSRMMTQSVELRNHPFTIAVYGETDGRLDENKLFGKKVSTVVDELGDIGTGLEHSKQWGFDLTENPVKVKGTFYIAFEFDETMPIDSDDPNITRSYVCFASVQHKSQLTTLYARPTAGPEGFTPDGGWYRVDQIDPKMAGLGIYTILWGSLSGEKSSVALTSDGMIAYALRNTDSTLTVSGTVQDDTLRIYNTAGVLLISADSQEDSTEISIDSLPSGIYIVTCSKGSLKFVK